MILHITLHFMTSPTTTSIMKKKSFSLSSINAECSVANFGIYYMRQHPKEPVRSLSSRSILIRGKLLELAMLRRHHDEAFSVFYLSGVFRRILNWIWNFVTPWKIEKELKIGNRKLQTICILWFTTKLLSSNTSSQTSTLST